MSRPNNTSAAAVPIEGKPSARVGRNVPGIHSKDASVSLSEPLLDSQAVAALLNVRVSWVRDAARLGQLPCLRVGRHLRFSRVMLEDWLAGQFTSPPPSAQTQPRPVAGLAAGGGGRSGRGGFRRSTQAALLASLAEIPRSKEIDDDK